MQQQMKGPKRQQQRDLPRAVHGVPITELLPPILPARDQNLLAKRKSKTGSQSYHEKAPHPPQSIDQAALSHPKTSRNRANRKNVKKTVAGAIHEAKRFSSPKIKHQRSAEKIKCNKFMLRELSITQKMRISKDRPHLCTVSNQTLRVTFLPW
jgi:hypothetical protein